MRSSSSKPQAAVAQTIQTTSDSLQQSQEPDKLREGPCSDIFALLEKCQQEKRIKRNDRALTFCVSETDLLIKCIHRNPAYFLDKK